LLAGFLPLLLLSYLALQVSDGTIEKATKTATEALDEKSLLALQTEATQTAQSISDLLNSTAQDTLTLSLINHNSDAYQAFYKGYTGEIRYVVGSEKEPQERRERIPLFREVTYIDGTGQERVRVQDGRLVPASELRQVSDPANTTYRTEDYFAETKKLPKGEVYVSRLTAWHTSVKNQPASETQALESARYGKYQGLIRFATPLYNERNEFDGMVMLSLDHRHIMEYSMHIMPVGNQVATAWPDYANGNYAVIGDDQGYLISHPVFTRLRGVGADGNLLPIWTPGASSDEKKRGLFNFLQGDSATPDLYQAILGGKVGVAINVNQSGAKKANVYAPIVFNRGVYSKSGLFGGLIIGANVDRFHEAALAARKSMDNEQNQLQNYILLLSLGAIVLLVLGAIPISRGITRPVLQVAETARAMERANLDTVKLDKVINRRISDEVTNLAQVFKHMAEEVQSREQELKVSNEKLEEYSNTLEQKVTERTAELEKASLSIFELNNRLKAENLRMGAELDVTRRLQQMILPKEPELAAIIGLDIAGFMEPADEVGGDYYDVMQQSDGRVKIGIGDVTGHGLESGVLMIMVQTAVRTLLATNETNPVRFMEALNQTIYDNVQRMNSDKTLTLSLLDYQAGKLLLSGQHEELLIVRSNGQIELIDTMDLGFPIGLKEDISDLVAQTQVLLETGDVVVLYTDGITEAENPQNQHYGLPRLCEIVQDNRAKAATQIKEAIIKDVMDYISTQKVYDDITLLVIKQKEISTVLAA